MIWNIHIDNVWPRHHQRLMKAIILLRDNISLISNTEVKPVENDDKHIVNLLEATIWQLDSTIRRYVASNNALHRSALEINEHNSELQRQLNDAQAKILHLQQQSAHVPDELQRQFEQAKSEAAAIQKELDRAHADLKALKEQRAQSLSNADEFSQSKFQKPSEMAEQAIALRDWLIITDRNGKLTSDVLVAEAERSILIMLAKEGITNLDKSGRFDEMTQEVYAKEMTPESEANETIASTYLPGYRINGRLLRAQKVIVFCHEQK